MTQHRSPTLRIPLLFTLLLALPLIFLLFPSGSAVAQEGTGDGLRPWPVATVGLKGSRIAGRARVLPGAWLGLGLTRHTLVAGGGFRSGVVLLDSRPGADPASLQLGYGGILTEHRHPLGGDWSLAGTLLLGGGHAVVRNRSVGFELGADNFGIVEPEITTLWRLASPLELALGAGYRWVFGVQDLPGVVASDLRGATLTLGLRLSGR